MGLTPAQEGTLPVNLNHGDSFGASRIGSIDETSVDDLRWYHQYNAGKVLTSPVWLSCLVPSCATVARMLHSAL
eukprot:6179492-Pleurochrysis_carterae.AAC.4